MVLNLVDHPVFDISHTRELLNWNPIRMEQISIEMGESLIKFGVVRKERKKE